MRVRGKKGRRVQGGEREMERDFGVGYDFWTMRLEAGRECNDEQMAGIQCHELGASQVRSERIYSGA